MDETESFQSSLPPFLASHGHSALPDALRQRIPSIIRQWVQDISHVLPAADKLTWQQLRNDLPDVLEQLAAALQSGRMHEVKTLADKSPKHGKARFHQGFSQRELLSEYALLRRTVVQQLEQQLDRALSAEEAVDLHLGLDLIIQQSVLEFSSHQHAQLRAAATAEAQFLSFLSHDLRNNLNGINLTLELLRHRLGAEPGFEEDVQDIDRVRDTMMSTIAGMERLLQWERLRAGTPQVQRSQVDLREMIEDVLAPQQADARRKGLRLVIDAPAQANIHTDRELLSLIVQNLVANAIKYSEAGEIRVAVLLRDRRCEISVSDQGPGIPLEQRDALFQAYQRGPTRGQSGLGLGLAIVSRAAEALRADVSIESVVGAGSTFRISLPVGDQQPLHPSPPPRRASSAS